MAGLERLLSLTKMQAPLRFFGESFGDTTLLNYPHEITSGWYNQSYLYRTRYNQAGQICSGFVFIREDLWT